MTDLFEEIEAMGEVDEDNFIYFNEQGKLELKQELVFIWSQFPSKKFHVTCRPSDSIIYVKTLLSVLIEKFSIFLGLKNFKILNIHNSKITLPEKGIIGEIVKSDTVFSFDLESSDIWLEIQIDFSDMAAVIFFEVKVLKETRIYTLKKLLADLLNHILDAENNSVAYSEEHILLQNIRMTNEVILATDLKSSLVTQNSKVKKFEDLKDDDLVQSTFSYINRYILCIPQPGRISSSNIRRKSIIREAYNPTILRVLQNTEFGFQVRTPRTEVKLMGKTQKVYHKDKLFVEPQNSKVCNCIVI